MGFVLGYLFRRRREAPYRSWVAMGIALLLAVGWVTLLGTILIGQGNGPVFANEPGFTIEAIGIFWGAFGAMIINNRQRDWVREKHVPWILLALYGTLALLLASVP